MSMKWCVCGTMEHIVNTRNCVCVKVVECVMCGCDTDDLKNLYLVSQQSSIVVT